MHLSEKVKRQISEYMKTKGNDAYLEFKLINKK